MKLNYFSCVLLCFLGSSSNEHIDPVWLDLHMPWMLANWLVYSYELQGYNVDKSAGGPKRCNVSRASLTAIGVALGEKRRIPTPKTPSELTSIALGETPQWLIEDPPILQVDSFLTDAEMSDDQNSSDR